MKIIDIESWKRKEHFNFFHRMDYPQYNICMDLDISNFLAFTKVKNLSFYYSMIHAVTTVLNTIDDFKIRIREDKIVLHDKIHPSFTDTSNDPDDNLFKFVTINIEDDIFEFVKRAIETNQNQKDYFPIEEFAGRDDLIYITCIPWISFTHISHTISLNRNDSVPRISWGKYYKKEAKTWLPFSVQVNHALLDGFHIGIYTEKLQKYLDEIR